MTHEEHRRALLNDAAGRVEDARRADTHAQIELRATELLLTAAQSRAKTSHNALCMAESAAAYTLCDLAKKGAISASPGDERACTMAESPEAEDDR